MGPHCCGFNETNPHKLMYFHAWSPVAEPSGKDEEGDLVAVDVACLKKAWPFWRRKYVTTGGL